MKINKIEHIGIAVKNLDESIKLYENIFGLKCYNIEEVKNEKVRTAFFQIGETKIELLESTEENSPINKFISKRGEGIHHIAFAIDNLSKSLEELKSKNINLINETPKKGAEDFNIAFIHPKEINGVLIELCEKEN